MHIAYYDESGDDGYPIYSSPLFVLSSAYLYYMTWQPSYERLRDFRKNLKITYNIPVLWELHAKNFILNKNPFHNLHLSDNDREKILDDYCDLIGNLEIKLINIVIVKPYISHPQYNVLNTALKYSVQRIENDLNPAQNLQSKFIIITDPGRVGKMRHTTRRIQRINYIPSKFSTSTYRREIKTLLEDPLPKDSKDSYFIQLVDLITYIVYLYAAFLHLPNQYHSRLPAFITPQKIQELMERLKPSLNLQASNKDPYGVVFYP